MSKEKMWGDIQLTLYNYILNINVKNLCGVWKLGQRLVILALTSLVCAYVGFY